MNVFTRAWDRWWDFTAEVMAGLKPHVWWVALVVSVVLLRGS